ncbi:MAG: carbohydrate ABC transporter permease [Oscillospiraceae bacterium]|nr:carbohydrate ABC transporter permease [Oscillospiraceae bacterium]
MPTSQLNLTSNIDISKMTQGRGNAIKDTPARVVFKVFNYIFLFALGVVCLVPLWHIAMLSFSNPTLIQRNTGLVLWPLGLAPFSGGQTNAAGAPLNATLSGYQVVLSNAALLRGYANTIFYVGSGCFLSILFGAIGAYCVSRKNTLFMMPLLAVLMVSMFFNGGLVPTYMVYKGLGMVNTRWSLVLNGMLNMMNIIILMTAFRGLPDGLEESAQLDGAGHMTILFKIALPLCKASIAVIALFYAIGKWNDYLQAAIYVNGKRSLYPLQLIIRDILTQPQSPTGMEVDIATSIGPANECRALVEYTTIMFSTIPLLCFYPFVQKYFVKGIMIGSIKG